MEKDNTEPVKTDEKSDAIASDDTYTDAGNRELFQNPTKPKMKAGLIHNVWFWAAFISVVVFAVAAIVVFSVNYHEPTEPAPTNTYDPRSPVYLYERDEKPIIYLYPTEDTEVSVKLGEPEKLIASYPSYTDGWNVLAEPSGRLTDLNTGRELYSLYWEGVDGGFGITDEGFVVKGDDVAGFLEEKLAILGLNEREAEEFIVYWLPKMQENEYNYVRFATAQEINSYMPLRIEPSPDTTIRVLMLAKPLDQKIDLKEQVLPSAPERNGFTVVEWGGSALDDSIVK